MSCDTQLDEMIGNIKNVVQRTLEKSHWMDKQSRDAAVDKVHLKLIL